MKRYGPSHRRAQSASAAVKIFPRHPKKTFATISAHFGHAVVAGQCLLLGVGRTCRSTLVTSGFHPPRKSATGSGSGSGRLVVEIVGGVTEVSLHVRYGDIGAVLTRQDILTNLQCGPSRR